MARAPRLAGTGREQSVVVPSSKCETSGLAGCDEKLLTQMGTAEFGLAVAHGDRVRRGLADQEDLLFAARDRGVEQIALQHHEVRLEQYDHHRRIFRALALVNADAVGRRNVPEIAALEHVLLAIKVGNQRAAAGVDRDHGPDVTVEQALIVVVAELNELVTGPEFASGSSQGGFVLAS